MDLVLDHEENVKLEARGCAVQVEGEMDIEIEDPEEEGEGGIECQVKENGDKPLYCIDEGRNRSEVIPQFDYTGSLRPYPISPCRRVPDTIIKTDYYDTGIPKMEINSKYRHVVPRLSSEEQEKMRRAGRIGREVLDAAHRIVKPGVTTDEIDRVVHDACIERVGWQPIKLIKRRCGRPRFSLSFESVQNAYPAPLNYRGFPKSVCTSVNEVICHGVPDFRELEDGDTVNVDVTVVVDGYHGDLSETYCVGNVESIHKELIQTTYDSLFAAIKICKSGQRFCEIGKAISKVATERGFKGIVRDYCGHGIGKLFHCAPNILHYWPNRAPGVMKAGNCFTIEPMINAGSQKNCEWPDGWTVVTEDGKRSAMFEHTLLCTTAGVEVLTARLSDSPPLDIDTSASNGI